MRNTEAAIQNFDPHSLPKQLKSVNATRVSSQPDLLQFRTFSPPADAAEVSQRCGHYATSKADFLK